MKRLPPCGEAHSGARPSWSSTSAHQQTPPGRADLVRKGRIRVFAEVGIVGGYIGPDFKTSTPHRVRVRLAEFEKSFVTALDEMAAVV